MTVSLVLTALAAATVADFQLIVDQFRDEQEIPGVSAVVAIQGEDLFAGGSGVADLETGREITADTILYAGSLSKILTAVLVLQLADQGSLSLEDTVADIAVESARETNGVTVRHLLTHSSGLDREGDFGYWFSGTFPDQAALADYLAHSELRSVPGKKVRYSNIGYAAIGPVIQSASGESYAEALNSRVLQPLKMLSTGGPGPVPNIATGYTPVGRVIPNEDRPFAGVGEPVNGRHVREYHDAGAMTPAFGLYSSASDLSRLARFILGYNGDEVFSADLRRLMLTPQVPGRGIGLRIGQLNGREIARHDGWFAAHRSHVLLDLDAGISVVVIANSDSASPDEIAEALLAEALKQ
jgi:D-alanyl-D-alanine carboxypeptidase